MSEVVRWRLHLASPPEAVWELLATDAGRARWWAESAAARDGEVEFRALEAAADHAVDLRNHDARRTWTQGYCDN